MAYVVNLISGIKSPKLRKIIFITHKEYSEWTGEIYWSSQRKIFLFPFFLLKKIKGFFIKLMITNSEGWKSSIKVVHWGFAIPKARHMSSMADVHLCDKDTAEGLSKAGANFLLQTSKDFTPSPYQYIQTRHEFKWDIISVSHNSKRKRLDLLFRLLRKLLDSIPNLTALVIVNTPAKAYRRNGVSTDVNFIDYYYKNFSYKERQQICLLRISDEQALEGASPGFINWAMTNADEFVFCSEKEGSAKVIKEATNLGCVAHVWKNLLGGTITGISPKRLVLFQNYDQLYHNLLNRISKKHMETKRTARHYSNAKAVNRLESFLREKKLISKNEKLTIKEFEFANRWLPAHLGYSKHEVTHDLLSILDVYKFLKKI